MAQLSWGELIVRISDVILEPEDAPETYPVGEVDIPYYTKDQIEASLLEISQQLLREIPQEELEAIGSDAIDTSDFSTSGDPLIATTVKILSVAIQPLSSDTTVVPAQPVPPSIFIQSQLSDPTIAALWSVFNGGLNFTGFKATVVSLLEPPLATWQTATSPILPDGYDETRIDWVVKQLQAMNFIPKGVL